MRFTYTYRDRSGALSRGHVDAASRHDALAQIRRSGITPIKLVESNVSGSVWQKKGRRGITLKMKWSLGGTAVLVIVLMVVCVLRVPIQEEPPEPVSEISRTNQTSVGKAGIPTSSVHAEDPLANMPPAVANVEAKPTNAIHRAGFTRQMKTLADGTQVPLRRSVFTNAIERAFSTLCNPGGMAIPFSLVMRRYSEEQIRRILETPMSYDPSDSEEIAQRKHVVQQLKETFRAYLAEGKSLQEAIREIDVNVRKEGFLQNLSQRGLREAIRSGDGEIVRNYVERQNEKLRAKGMRELSVPARFGEDSGEQASQTKQENNE